MYKNIVFHTKPLLRIYRYLFLLLFIILPLYLASLAFDATMVRREDVVIHILMCSGLAVIDCVLVHCFFWEKFFATLTFSDEQIIWKCPFRKTIKLAINECNYVGVQLEESHNGLPYPFVFFSVKPYPYAFRGKINKLPCKEEFIKFWYTEELSDFLVGYLPSDKKGQILAYRIQSKRKA